MPVMIQARPTVRHRPSIAACRQIWETDGPEAVAGCIDIGLINNMPPAALHGTEVRFVRLLEAAAPDLLVRLRRYTLPEIRRTAGGLKQLTSCYFDIDDLWDHRLDVLIVTGTEPREADLMAERYWGGLAGVLEWAVDNTIATILSCLAAHAGALYFDGIDRRRLPDKRFGVYDHARVSDHFLTNGVAAPLSSPHSRWNEIAEEPLTSCGYSILTKSHTAGADLFVKGRKGSLFLHFQGHPEYGSRTLLKEYRRDIERFLRHERESYPSMPAGYFDAKGTRALIDFRERVLRSPDEHVLAEFPEVLVGSALKDDWRLPAIRIFRNLLRHVADEKSVKRAPRGLVQHRKAVERTATIPDGVRP